MAHVHKNRKQLLTRVRRIGGQVAALEQAFYRPEGASGDLAVLLVQVSAWRRAAHTLPLQLLLAPPQATVVAAAYPPMLAPEADVLVILLRRYG